MRKSKKLNKTALEVINQINTILRLKSITDNTNDLFIFGVNYLLKKNMYHGYNMFTKVPGNKSPLDNNLYENGYFLTEAGTDKNFDCLQIYISSDLTITDNGYRYFTF